MDQELVTMCLDGDALAWEALIKRYRRSVYAIPIKFGLTPGEASDVFQSVCVKLIEHLHELKDEKKVGAWLFSTTTRECMRFTNDKEKETPTADEEFEDRLDPALNLEEIRLEAESRQELRDIVELLPPRCRALIQMLYFDVPPVSYQDISEALGISPGSVGATRARCFDKLRRLLRERGSNEKNL
jgi:RNA polymerase sigma factor (sigma-70 family)